MCVHICIYIDLIHTFVYVCDLWGAFAYIQAPDPEFHIENVII